MEKVEEDSLKRTYKMLFIILGVILAGASIYWIIEGLNNSEKLGGNILGIVVFWLMFLWFWWRHKPFA